MIITLVPTEHVGEFWPTAQPFIEKALEANPGYYRMVDVLDKILHEMEALWAVLDDDGTCQACFTTTINQYPLCRRLTVHHVGGDYLDEWQDDCWEILASYAKDTGCSGIDAYGRDGWRSRARMRGVRIRTTYSFDIG